MSILAHSFMIVDGKKIAQAIQHQLLREIAEFKDVPEFHIIYVGSDPVIDNFIRYKKMFGEGLGVHTVVHRFPEHIKEKELISHIHDIAQQASGMIVQLPLPKHLDTETIVSAVPPECDIDVLGIPARELFARRELSFFPPVTGAIVRILEHHEMSLDGEHIVLIGKGQLVGYPTSLWLEREGYSYDIVDGSTDDDTRHNLLSQADVIISGVGQPGMIRPDMISPGVMLFDAGTSESQKKILGDIDPACYDKASLVTPVPGGIGPLTIAILYENLVKAHRQRYDRSSDTIS